MILNSIRCASGIPVLDVSERASRDGVGFGRQGRNAFALIRRFRSCNGIKNLEREYVLFRHSTYGRGNRFQRFHKHQGNLLPA